VDDSLGVGGRIRVGTVSTADRSVPRVDGLKSPLVSSPAIDWLKCARSDLCCR